MDNLQETYKIGEIEITLDKASVKRLTNNNPYITDDEIARFIALCKYQKLNPYVGDAFLVKADRKPENGGAIKPAQLVVSYGAFQKRADENPNYDGQEDGIIVATANGTVERRAGCLQLNGESLVGAWCRVFRKDRKIPTYVEISWKECGKGTQTWKVMPCIMLNKCAKAKGLRETFATEFKGMYIAEEMGEDDIPAEYRSEVAESEPEVDITDIIENEDEQADETATSPEVAELQQTNAGNISTAPQAINYQCSKCGAKISKSVSDFSLKTYGRTLCVACQREIRTAK